MVCVNLMKIPRGRVCKKCREFLVLESFTPNPAGLYGRYSVCKKCVNWGRRARGWRDFPPSSCTQLIVCRSLFKPCSRCERVLPLEKFSVNEEDLYGRNSRCRDCVGFYHVSYYGKTKDKKAAYYRENKEEIVKAISIRKKEMLKTDNQFRLTCLLRSRLTTALKGGNKVGSAVGDLGCSGNRLRIFLEKHSKYCLSDLGKKKVHVDHIVPLSAYDLEDRKELLKAVHYTNLQLLWWEDNFRKHDSIPDFVPYYGALIWRNFPSLYPKDKSCAGSTLRFSGGINA